MPHRVKSDATDAGPLGGEFEAAAGGVAVLERLAVAGGEHRKVVPDVARWVAARAAPGDRVASYRLNRWNTAYRFYVNRHTDMLESPEEALAFFDRPEPFYCAMLTPAYEEFVAQGVPLRVVYSREGMWATSGRVLWRRRIPPTEFVVVTRAP